MSKSKVSKEVENAAMVQALLAGGSIDSAVEDAAMIQNLLSGGIPDTVNYEDDEDDLEIDMSELENPKKKKKGSGAKKAKAEEVKPAKKDTLEDCMFATIEKSKGLVIRFGDHDIPYKEQLWPIPERDVDYLVERIDGPMEAANAAEQLYGKSFNAEVKAKAKTGEYRYLRIVSYENVPMYSKCLGYVEIKPDKKIRTVLIKDNVKKSHADENKIMGAVKNCTRQMVKYI